MGTYALDYRHNCLVVYRRRIWELWRKTYWVICIYCAGQQGPHRERTDAWLAASCFNHHDTLPDHPRLALLQPKETP